MALSAAARAKARAAAVDKALGRFVILECGHGAYYDDQHVLVGKKRYYCCRQCGFSLMTTRRSSLVPHRDDCAGCYKCTDEPRF